MPNAQFTAYAIDTDYRRKIPGVPFDHTFVLSDANDDWNCWGRGVEGVNQGANLISTGSASAQWAKGIYGTDPNYPTGLLQFVEGVFRNQGDDFPHDRYFDRT